MRQNLGLYSRNIKVPGSSAMRLPGEANRRAKGKQKKIFVNITNKHDAILEVYSIEMQGNAKKIADIEPDQTKQLFCLNKGHEFVIVNKETLFEVATVYGAEEDQNIVLRPTLGLNFVNTGPETVEVIQLLEEKEEKGLEVYLHPGQNVDYWSLLGDTFIFRSSVSGKLILQHLMKEECQVMVPSSSAEEQRGKELTSVLSIKNTFDFPLEIFPHEEDDLVEVESFEIPAGGQSLQLECPIVGQLYKVLNQETKEVIAHVTGGCADQFLLIGPQTFLEIKNSIRAATVEEVTLHVYYQPPDQDEEYLYDADVLERGDSMEIECLLGSTWLVRNSVSHDLLMRYTVSRQAEDTNLVVLSNSSTVLDDPENPMATKIHFINELGFTVLIYKQDPTAPGQEQLLTQLLNHGQL